MIKSVGAAAVLVAVGTLLCPLSASAATRPLPFEAAFSGTANLTSPTSFSFAGAGTATLMGQVTTVGNAVVTGSTNTICPGGFAKTNVNSETLTAANGDTLTIVSDDEACPTGPGQVHGTGHWNVTGGTGRFSGATGDGCLDGHADFVAGTFAVELTGTIVLDY
jgi:hypothetical protein